MDQSEEKSNKRWSQKRWPETRSHRALYILVSLELFSEGDGNPRWVLSREEGHDITWVWEGLPCWEYIVEGKSRSRRTKQETRTIQESDLVQRAAMWVGRGTQVLHRFWRCNVRWLLWYEVWEKEESQGCHQSFCPWKWKELRYSSLKREQCGKSRCAVRVIKNSSWIFELISHQSANIIEIAEHISLSLGEKSRLEIRELPALRWYLD